MYTPTFGPVDFDERQAWRRDLVRRLESQSRDAKLSIEKRANCALSARRLAKVIEMQDAKRAGRAWHPGYFH